MSGRPELLCYGLDANFAILETCLMKATMVVLGPGLGQSTWSKKLFEKVLLTSLPIIIDADGLNWLARSNQSNSVRPNWILTPHPGEAARLLDITVADVQKNRPQAVMQLQQHFGGTVVLKGANTLVATQGQPIVRCLAGNPGMAVAGMGDLLSGMIAGLAAQGFPLWKAAYAGVMLHATAGDSVALRQGERGLLPSDLLAELPRLVNAR